MQILPRISSSLTEPWVAWGMLILLVLLLGADILQRGIVVSSFKGLRLNKERDSLFDTSQYNFIGRLCLLLYKIAMFTLALYAVVCDPTNFHFLPFLTLCGITIGMLTIKWCLTRLIAFVFFDLKTYNVASHQYMQLTTCCAVLLYPIMLLVLFVPQIGRVASGILLGLVLFFFIIVLLIKIFHLFFHTPLASLHIFLYLCTLEALPLVGLFYVTRMLVYSGTIINL